MKKLFVPLVVTGALLSFHTTVKAEWVPPVQLGLVPVYADSIPVVKNNFNGYFLDVVGEKQPVSELLSAGTKILEINGISAIGKSTDELNEMMRQSDTLCMTVAYSVHGDTCTAYDWTFIQKNNQNGYGDLIDVQREYLRNVDKNRPNDGRPSSIRVINDHELLAGELNFSKIKTYDIMITGDDPLTDKKILEKFCSSGFFWELKRDEENPDIIVCVAKNSQESISSTYVPPTSKTINTGSVTRPVYNYLTKTYSYVTTQRNRTVTTDGYTQSTTNTSIYLEFTILDAKRLNDPAQKTAPIIWQMTYTRNVTNREFEVLDEYIAIASWNCYPFITNPSIKVPKWFIGANFSSVKQENSKSYYSKVVSGVVPESSAAKLGLQRDDIIIKINNSKKGEKVARRSLNTKFLDSRVSTRTAEDLGDRTLYYYGLWNHKWTPHIYSTYFNNLVYLIERDGVRIKLTGKLMYYPNAEISQNGGYYIWR